MEQSKNESSDSCKPSSPVDRKSEPQLKLPTTSTSYTGTAALNIAANITSSVQDSSLITTTQRQTPTPPKRNSITSLETDTPVGTTHVTSSVTETSGIPNQKGHSASANTESLGSKKSVFIPIPTTESPATSLTVTADTIAATKPNTATATLGVSQHLPPSTTSSHSYSQHYKVGSVGTMVVAIKRSSSDMQSTPEPKASGTSNRGEQGSMIGDSGSGGGSDPKRKKIRKENKSEASDEHKSGRSRTSSSKPKVTFAGMPSNSGKLSMTANVDTKYFGQNDSEKETHSTANPVLGVGNGGGCVATALVGADTQEKSEITGHGASSSGGNANSSNGGGLKVPPIKIVLQSHPQSHSGSSASNTINESENLNARGHDGHSQGSSGFPYVVSSTTESGGHANFESNKAKETTSSPLAVSSSENPPNPTSGTASVAISSQTAGSANPSTTSVAAATVSFTSNPVTTSTPTILVSGSIPTTVAAASISSPAPLAPPPARLPPKSAGERKGLPSVAVTISSSQPSGTPATHKDEKDKGSKSNASASGSTIPATSTGSTASTSAFNSSSISSTAGLESTNATQETHLNAGAPPAAPQPPQVTKEKEKPHRVTRSSQRIATHHGHGSHANASSASTVGPNSPMNGNSPKTSACPSPSNPENVDAGSSVSALGKSDATEKMDTSESTLAVPSVELHPRKRKIKTKDPTTACSSSSSTSGEANEITAGTPGQAQEQPVLNCFEMFLNIRKQIDRRRKNMFPVQPKPPQGFKDYLMNRGTYVLANTANARLAVPFLNPPQAISSVPLKELFVEQEKVRHKLRLQHLVEKEKLVLSVEQEILRVHGRAARALSNQAVPFSVCTILKDNEVYNLLTPEQEEKDRNARSRYNGRLFISWLQDVDDKWDKIKESMLLRHHNESESLHAVQKMDWEWKLKEVGLCEPKSTATIDESHVPMVHVSDDFDLRP